MILYDEPTTGLDPIMTDVINELIFCAREIEHPSRAFVRDARRERDGVEKVADG